MSLSFSFPIANRKEFVFYSCSLYHSSLKKSSVLLSGLLTRCCYKSNIEFLFNDSLKADNIGEDVLQWYMDKYRKINAAATIVWFNKDFNCVLDYTHLCIRQENFDFAQDRKWCLQTSNILKDSNWYNTEFGLTIYHLAFIVVLKLNRKY